MMVKRKNILCKASNAFVAVSLMLMIQNVYAQTNHNSGDTLGPVSMRSEVYNIILKYDSFIEISIKIHEMPTASFLSLLKGLNIKYVENSPAKSDRIGKFQCWDFYFNDNTIIQIYPKDYHFVVNPANDLYYDDKDLDKFLLTKIDFIRIKRNDRYLNLNEPIDCKILQKK